MISTISKLFYTTSLERLISCSAVFMGLWTQMKQTSTTLGHISNGWRGHTPYFEDTPLCEWMYGLLHQDKCPLLVILELCEAATVSEREKL